MSKHLLANSLKSGPSSFRGEKILTLVKGERDIAYQYDMGRASVQGYFVEGLLLGSKWGYSDFQMDTFADWASHLYYKERALDDWWLAQGS